jgi:hypothetical protein
MEKKNMLSLLIPTYDLKLLNVISLNQANPERKYNNQSEVMDDMLDNIFICMQELEVNIGNIIYLIMRI